MKSKLIHNLFMVIIGFIWWLVFWLTGKIDIPMWMYRAVFSAVLIYLPLFMWALIRAAKEMSQNEEEPPSQKPLVSKVYGSSSK